MTEDLGFRTRQQYPVAVVEMKGDPGGSCAADLADALREHLGEQPAALIVDLSSRVPGPHRRTLRDLPPMPHVLRSVRQLVGEACESWGVVSVASSAQLVASELVSNSIEHTGTNADVTIALREGWLHIVVRDGSRELPQRPADPSPNAPRGRGLALIDELSSAWVVLRTSTGKLVWAVLPVGDERDRRTAPRRLAGNHC